MNEEVVHVVIEISKDKYNLIKNTVFVEDTKTMFDQSPKDRQGTMALFALTDAVKRGIVLPEQYGDLIDRDELLKDDVGKIMGFRECDILKAHTILKAIKEK